MEEDINKNPEILKNGLIGEIEDFTMYKEVEEQRSKENNSIVRGVPFTKDDPRINRNGRPPETEETKLVRKAQKDLIKEYRGKLTEALPLISPVLIAKALEGDLPAIKELNDRVMGKAKETVEMQGGLNIQFADVFNKENEKENN